MIKTCICELSNVLMTARDYLWTQW